MTKIPKYKCLKCARKQAPFGFKLGRGDGQVNLCHDCNVKMAAHLGRESIRDYKDQEWKPVLRKMLKIRQKRNATKK